MTFAKRNILRRIPTGPTPVITDYVQLLGPKLRVAYDVREGGDFAPGAWISHKDLVSGLLVTAPAPAQRPGCIVDGAYFRGRSIIRITFANSLKMINANVPNIVPAGTRAEVYAIARIPSFGGSGNLCGSGDPGAASNSGASMWRASGGVTLNACSGGDVSGPFTDTASVHLLSSHLDASLTRRALVDNVEVGSSGPGLVAFPTTQIAIGGFATGFVSSTDAHVAAWGIVAPPMTDAERAQFLEIARADWGF